MNKLRLLRNLLLIPVIAALIGLGFIYYQGQQGPRINSPYVALGSSFAAGLGLGRREAGSPLVCQRSINGYPQQLARLTGLALTDMSCSGATMRHVLYGGQIFLGPQIGALGKDTRLVTLTAGGNDVGYVGDLTMMAYKRKGGLTGQLVGLVWKGPHPLSERDFAGLGAALTKGLREIRRRAPEARIVVALYPAILPESGSCRRLGIGKRQAELMRLVAARLAETSREAVIGAGATIVDTPTLSRGHDACSSDPWVNGADPSSGAPFHPTLAGAQAVAQEILKAGWKNP